MHILCSHKVAPKEVRICLFFSFFFKFIYLFILREKESTSRGGIERGRIPSRLCTASAEPNVELKLRNCEIVT